jgi:hypothetical protein
MRKLKLFFSWQSDTPDNHKLMRKGIEKACKKLKEKNGYNIVYDESTRGEAGSPDIVDIIEKKIDHCDIFIADVSPIATKGCKLISNSNVMLELGRAFSVLRYQKIIIIAKKDGWRQNELAFDFSHRAIIQIDVNDENIYYSLIRSSAEFAYKNPESIFDVDDQVLYSDFAISKNIKSGKYLPKVFLERKDFKEHFRYFADPFLFSNLVYERISKLNFERMNRLRRIKGLNEFDVDVSTFKPSNEILDFSSLFQLGQRLKQYLKEKNIEFNGRQDNENYLNSSKIGRKIVDISFILSRIIMLTGNAGQGKTNFICDFVQNVLLKRRIPFAYLNGYEIDANNIEKSFLDILCPGRDISWNQCLGELKNYCEAKQRPMIFIIDGLNENLSPRDFSQHLETFLKVILLQNNIKVIMSCRNQYYQEHFENLAKTFVENMIVEKNIYSELRENDEDKLLNNYLSYFHITARIENYAKDKLTKDFLLLRIFCEANNNKSLGYVHHLKRDELFMQYYSSMCNKVVKSVDWPTGINLANIELNDFFLEIVHYMINNDKFFNVPLDELCRSFSTEQKTIFSRFLDENILLRKDLSENKGPFGKQEVVNFTYDAFRDFLLAHYIINELSKDVVATTSAINKYTNKDHQLREGIIPFLFVYAMNSHNNNVISIIKQLDWYIEVFDNLIWDVDEQNINDGDITLLKQRLANNPAGIAPNLIFWGHWRLNDHPHLNIKLLIEYLESLDDEALTNFMEMVWSTSHHEKFNYRQEKSERDQLIDLFDQLIGDDKLFKDEDAHLLFVIFLFVAVVSGKSAQDIYLKYLIKRGNMSKTIEISEKSNSQKVKSYVESLVKII